jgi:hypothetical protein
MHSDLMSVRRQYDFASMRAISRVWRRPSVRRVSRAAPTLAS